ncbi:MAG: GDP-mannose 4,6-dehydratase, partial [Vicinamibacteria bacterium]|nr:GDP-mannose 4,6-dehydratase [Vicinamibacteria bacterium]
LLGHPLTVFGDGSQTRCFTYVSDVVGALMKLAELDECVGEVVNIGNDREEVSILELARRVKERTRSKSEIVFVPYEKAYEEGFEDMPRRIPALDKLRRLIGYEPQVHLDEILDRVAAYFTSDKGRL